MKENFISFLEDNTKISDLWLYFVAGLIVILILKSLLKSIKIKPKIFDNIILFVYIIFLILVISNIIITENYGRLWNVLFVFIIIILLKVVPKFMKWYDGKIDKFSEKI
jgi:hypothetical protein